MMHLFEDGPHPPSTDSPGPDHALYQLEEVDDCVVVTADGEIDVATADGLHDAVQVAAQFSHRIVVDLTRVTFLDSTGLGALMGAISRAREKDGTVSLVGPTGVVRTALEATSLDEAFTLHDHIDDLDVAMTRPEAGKPG